MSGGDSAVIERPARRIEEVFVTPEHAAELLANAAPNRKLRRSDVRKYVRLMTSGRWRATLGDPVRVDWHRQLRDGQHRLSAVVESQIGQWFVVYYNVDPADQVHYDQGAKRAPSDQLQIRGIKHSTLKAAIANLLIDWEHGSIRTRTYRADIEEVVQLVLDNAEDMDDAVSVAYGLMGYVPAAPSVVGAVRLRTARIYPKESDRFFHELIHLPEQGDAPTMALRRILVRRAGVQRGERLSRPDRITTLYYFLTAWRAFLAGRPIGRLVAPHGGVRMHHVPAVDPNEDESGDDATEEAS